MENKYYMPTKAQVQVVIDNLTKVLPQALHDDFNGLHMLTANVCGTTLCHGGWYLISKMGKITKDMTDSDGDSYDFINGANVLAQDLGFDSIAELEDWAQYNSDIWGNEHGAGIFSWKCAFTPKSSPKGAENLQHIIDHWKEVQERLPV